MKFELADLIFVPFLPFIFAVVLGFKLGDIVGNLVRRFICINYH